MVGPRSHDVVDPAEVLGGASGRVAATSKAALSGSQLKPTALPGGTITPSITALALTALDGQGLTGGIHSGHPAYLKREHRKWAM